MKTKIIFIFFLLVALILVISVHSHNSTEFSRSNHLPSTASDSSLSKNIQQNDSDEININIVKVDGNNISIGQTFLIKGDFGPYEFKLEKIAQGKKVELSYSEKQIAERGCQRSNKRALVLLSLNNEKCLTSPTCDAGEKVCITIKEKNKNIILEYRKEMWDYGR